MRPGRDEADAYYFRYIDLVDATDIVHELSRQRNDVLAHLRGIPDGRSLHRYASDKWSIREVVAHVSDCERLFSFRAFWFARNFDTPLPSFDQNVANAAARADARPWTSIVDEFDAVRASSISFFSSLPDDAWSRRGQASGFPFSVRALAFLTAGHAEHHMRILRERYA